MGNEQSTIVTRKLSSALPENGDKWRKNQIFQDDTDREQFIYGVIAVLTNNGVVNLEGHDFKLLYSRRESSPGRIIARIVAIKDGVIKAKVEPDVDGADQQEAFFAFKKDVEIKLDRILQTIPSGPNDAGPSAARRVDAPPAYSSSAGGITNNKKG